MNRAQLKEEIIREIKHENRKVIGMTSDNIASVVEFQFQYVRRIMEAGAYEGVRLPYFGKFYARAERIIAVTNEAFRRKREQDTGKHRTQADP